ncbi:MAG: TIGR03619 family F420-dependent LLM class oxidoreductase [Nitrososphaerales archaeon]|jgi:probable F420-dependent oxidoreductase
MEIGISLPTTGRDASPDVILRVAREAEESGFASVWVSDRLLRSAAPPGTTGQERPAPAPGMGFRSFDPIETLSYVAARTERIKLGTSAIGALFQPPVILAKRLATLDQFSGGRVIAGLGQGWNPDEFAAAGVPMKRRGAGFEEYVSALRSVWGPDPVRFEGRFYRIAESEIGPKPLQRGGIPLILGASAPVSAERAGRIADGINLIAFSFEEVERLATKFLGAAKAAGRDAADLLVVLRSNNPFGGAELPSSRPLLSGSVEQALGDMERLEALGVNHVFVPALSPGARLEGRFEVLRRLLG